LDNNVYKPKLLHQWNTPHHQAKYPSQNYKQKKPWYKGENLINLAKKENIDNTYSYPFLPYLFYLNIKQA